MPIRLYVHVSNHIAIISILPYLGLNLTFASCSVSALCPLLIAKQTGH